jgi:5'-deoxynucleotidase YfbR-like HD superfamily hydrolase
VVEAVEPDLQEQQEEGKDQKGAEVSKIITYRGWWIDLLNPKPVLISIRDIAHALARIPRFNGHTPGMPYSVAEHSVRVCDLCPNEHKLWGLLHDAPEAYIGDVTTPLKAMLPRYTEIEAGIMRAIAVKFELPGTEIPDVVRAIDAEEKLREMRAIQAHDHCMAVYSYAEAEAEFMDRFCEVRDATKWKEDLANE